MRIALIAFGASSLVLGLVLYLALRDVAQWHGAAQLSQAVAGALALAFGLWMKERRP